MPETPEYYYYPALSGLITLDDLPESLSFIQDGIQQAFGNLYFYNYKDSIGVIGDSAFYDLNIVCEQKLAVEIPGTGIYLVLNPDFTDDNISTFPVTIFWEWQILQYVNYFNATGFSFSGEDLFNLALNIFNVSDEQALVTANSLFVTPTDPSITSFDQFVIDINNFYGSSITIDEDSLTPYQDLVTQLEGINEDVFSTIFSLCLTNDDPSVIVTNLDLFFAALIPSDLNSFITTITTPTARVTLELTAALEFPRNILLPMIQSGNTFTPDNTLDSSGNLKQAYIQFGDAILDFDTSTGFGYQTAFAGTLYPTYCQIANTCMVVSFSNVILDLSKTSSIPQIAAAGYPDSFVGAYVGSAAIIINGFGSDSTTNESASISVSNFIIGTGGVSGKVTLADQGILYRNFGNFSAELDTFSITFLQNVITYCTISGLITLNNYQINGQPAKIAIQAQIKDDGSFSVTALPQANLFTITLPNVFNLTIRTLTLGEEQPKGFYIQVSGTLDFIADIPVLGQILPKGINVTELRIWEDGSIDFKGGGLVIPKTFRLQIGPVKMQVSNISFGSYSKTLDSVDRNYRYFGFDGMINTGDAGVAASGNGIKYYFTVDDGPGKPFDNFIRIDGIAIDIIEPGDSSADDADFILKGFLKVSTPTIAGSPAVTEYSGGISVSMPPLGKPPFQALVCRVG